MSQDELEVVEEAKKKEKREDPNIRQKRLKKELINKLDKVKDFDQFCKEFNKPEAVLWYLLYENVEWGDLSSKKSPEIQWPDDIIKNKIGICFDHSIFMHCFCKRKNIENKILVVSWATDGDTKCSSHAMPLYKKNGKVYAMVYLRPGTGWIAGPYHSWDECGEDITHIHRGAVSHEFKEFTYIYWDFLNDEAMAYLDELYNKRGVSQIQFLSDNYFRASRDLYMFKLKYKGFTFYNPLSTALSVIDFFVTNMKKMILILDPEFFDDEKEKKEVKESTEEILLESNNKNKYFKLYKNFDEFCKTFDTPEEVIMWYRGIKFYWPDEPGSTMPFHWPDQLVHEGCGICFDNAVMMHYFCERKKIKHQLMIIRIFFHLPNSRYWNCAGHIITIYQNKKDDMFYIFDPKDERHGSYKFFNSQIYGPFMNLKESIEKYKYIFRSMVETIMKTKYGNTIEFSKETFTYLFTENNYQDLDKFYNDKRLGRDEWDEKYTDSWKGCKYKDIDGAPLRYTTRDPVQILRWGIEDITDSAINKLKNLVGMKEETEIVEENTNILLESYTSSNKDIIPLDIKSFKSDHERIICMNTHIINMIKAGADFTGITSYPDYVQSFLLPAFLPFIAVLASYNMVELKDQIDAVDFFAVDVDKPTDGLENTRVLSCNKGKVVTIVHDNGNFQILNKNVLEYELTENVKAFGNAVIISHFNGKYFSLYAHMKPGSIKVKLGQEVDKGDVLGLVGNTGNSSGPHLHFELFYDVPLIGPLPKRRLNFDIDMCTLIEDLSSLKLYYYLPMEKYKSKELNWCCFLTDPPNIVRESVDDIDDSFYFYHMVPAGTDVCDGLLSPYALSKLGKHEKSLNALDKYRNRMVDGWNIYPHKNPEELTEEELLEGLEKFRGEGGSKTIYFFRYPPTSDLGNNMADILKNKDIYRIDINDKEIKKYIVKIDYGYHNSNSDEEKYDREFYENISKEDYFKDYDDNPGKNKLLFASIPHIGIIFKDGICPRKFITMVYKNGEENIEEQCSDSYVYCNEVIRKKDEDEIVFEKMTRDNDLLKVDVKSFEQFCELYKTPEDAMQWFIYNKIEWTSGNKEIIRWPDILIKEKKGNCFDQSVFMHFFFKKKKIEHRLALFTIRVENGNYAGHIFPLFKRGKYYYAWLYLSPGKGTITGPFRDWYEGARLVTDYCKILIGTKFESPVNNDYEYSVQDYDETCLLDKYKDQDIIQKDYFYMNGGNNLWSTHFYTRDFTYFRIPKAKGIVVKFVDWMKKNNLKSDIEEISFGEPVEEEYKMSVYTKNYKTMEEFCKTFKTFEDLVLWFQSNNIKWPNYDERDKLNPVDWTGPIHWPEEILKDKIGNCFDQALFAYYFFKYHGMESRMYRFSWFFDKTGQGSSSTLQCRSHFVTIVKRTVGYFVFNYFGRQTGTDGPFYSYEGAVEHYTKILYREGPSSYIDNLYFINVIDPKSKMDRRVILRSGYFSKKDMEFFDKTYGDKRLTQNEYINHSEGCRFEEDKKVITHTYLERFLSNARMKTAQVGLGLANWLASKESTTLIHPTDEDEKSIRYIIENIEEEEKEWFGDSDPNKPWNKKENIPFCKVLYENGIPCAYVQLTDSGKLGLATGDVNISLAVHKDYRRKGYAVQLIKEAIHWFKESDFTTMSYIVSEKNKASYKLAEKCGFVYMQYWKRTKQHWFMITNPTTLRAIGESAANAESSTTISKGICDTVIDYLGNSLDIEKFSDLKSGKRFMYTRCTVMKKDIPLILFLSYCEGLTTVLRKAGVNFMFSDVRPRLKGMDVVNKGVIPFSDGYIIYDKFPLEISLLMNGFGLIDTKVLAYSEMDTKDVYVNIFDNIFGSRILANALDNFYECMIDPVTYTILEELNYPTEFVGLLLAGNKLLADNNFRDEIDMANYRIRSNEMAYAYAYKEISTAYSKFRMTSNNKNPNKISIPQSVILKDIMQSEVVEDVSELSPIVEVEKAHILTDKGPSGTNLKEAYTIRRRCFHPSMTGIVAMSQSPDANVGINRAMTMNPNVLNARGIVPPEDEKDMSEVNLYGCAELLTPGSMSHDDPTRGSMGVKQAKHIIPVSSASPVLVSNGSEKILPYHLSSDFVIVAKDDGKVISRDDKTGVAVLEYKNKQGKEKHQVINMNPKVVKNGAGGFYLVNKMNCDKLKKGATFKKNDILAYNSNFFSDSAAEGVRLNIGVLSKVACFSTYINYEDGDFVTDKLSKKLGTEVCMESTAVVGANSNVSYIVKKGQEVHVNDPLIIFDDSTDDPAFNKMLANIGKDLKEEITRMGKVPIKSKYSGVIEDIKIYTTVEPKKMSSSLRKIVEEHFRTLKAQDDEIKRVTKDGGAEGFAFTEHAEVIDGGEDGKIMGVKVGEGVYFRFFIKYNDYLDVGDKLVHFTAMKYVNAEMVPKGQEPFTLSHPEEEVSSVFGPGGVMARMTPSAFKTIYENKVIIELKRKWLEMYKKDNPSFKPKDELY